MISFIAILAHFFQNKFWPFGYVRLQIFVDISVVLVPYPGEPPVCLYSYLDIKYYIRRETMSLMVMYG